MANVIKHKRGSGSDPAANNLVLGELAIRTDVGKLFTKMDSGAIAEIAGGGSDIAINTLSSSSATGGGSATFNGSAYRFTLSAPPSVSAQQLLVSINGVIQKPVAGTGQPSEGFSVDGTDIILGDAPATGSDFFILTFKSLGVSEPADNSVTSAKIVNGTIVNADIADNTIRSAKILNGTLLNADINASAAIAGTKISPDFGSQAITTTGNLNAKDIVLTDTAPLITFNDSDHENDFVIGNFNGTFIIQDADVPVNRFTVATGGQTTITGNLDCNAGLDVTGAITGTGDLTIDTNTLHVDSSNNRVGIGTSSPDGKLDVRGTIFVNGDGTGGRIFASSGNLSLSDGNGRQILRIDDPGASNSHTHVFDSNGRLGIGTTSPDQKLQVEGSGSQYVAITSTDSDNTGILFGDSDIDAGFVLYANSDNSLRFATNGANERMRIDSSGKFLVGLTSGLSSQDGSIQAAGPIIAKSFINAHTSNAAVLQYQSNLVTLRAYGATSGSGVLAFSTGGGGDSTDTERMRIDSSGNVLVGGTSMGAAGSFGMEPNGHVRSILASGTTGDTLFGAISGVSNGFQINISGTNSQMYRFHNGSSVTAQIDSDGLKFNSGFGSVTTVYGCRAWVKLNQTGTQTINGSGGVSSIADLGVGHTQVNFATTMPDTHYAMVGGAQQSSQPGVNYGFSLCMQARNTGDANFIYRPAASSDTKQDNSQIDVAFFR